MIDVRPLTDIQEHIDGCNAADAFLCAYALPGGDELYLLIADSLDRGLSRSWLRGFCRRLQKELIHRAS